MRVLIPESQARNVLAAIRSLGRAGHSITLARPVGPKHLRSPSRSDSRFVNKSVYIESPHLSPSGFIRDLLRLVTTGDFDVLLPFTHASILPISYDKAVLSQHVYTPIAEYGVMRRAHDKLETVRVAQQLGVPTPVTFHPKGAEDLFCLREYLPFPCLVKARQGCGVGTTIRFATDFDQLVAGYEEISKQSSTPPVDDYSLPIIQEYVPGQIHDAVFLYSDGDCRGALTQERIVTYPIQGGIGVVNQTTDDPLLCSLGRKLLDALVWHGPAQVEFRLDPRDGTYKLLEINPKFWGTLPLAMVAGIDFALMACRLAYLGQVEAVFDYRVGITYRWLFPQELNTLAQEFTWRQLWEFVHFWKEDTYYDFDAGDPLPDVARIARSLRRLLLNRSSILPARQDLNELAMQRPPAQQPAEFPLAGESDEVSEH